jgi:hypothetical protein
MHGHMNIKNILCFTFIEFLLSYFYMWLPFQSPHVLCSYLMVLLHLSVSNFNHFCFKLCLSVCTPWIHRTVMSSCSHTDLGMCKYQFSTLSMPNSLHWVIHMCRDFIMSILYSFFAEIGHPNGSWSVLSSHSLQNRHLPIILYFKILPHHGLPQLCLLFLP